MGSEGLTANFSNRAKNIWRNKIQRSAFVLNVRAANSFPRGSGDGRTDTPVVFISLPLRMKFFTGSI